MLGWTALGILIILLLYPMGYLMGYARGRKAKVLTAIREIIRGGDETGDGDP